MTTEQIDEERDAVETIRETEAVDEQPVEELEVTPEDDPEEPIDETPGEDVPPEEDAPKMSEIPIHEVTIQDLFAARIRSKEATGVAYTNDEIALEMVSYAMLAGKLDACLAHGGASHDERSFRVRKGFQIGFRSFGEVVEHLTPALGDPSLAKASLKKPVEKKKRKTKKRKVKRKRNWRKSGKTKDGQWVN